jgi:CubicO group peptidase (beta-lactamase class C family)
MGGWEMKRRGTTILFAVAVATGGQTSPAQTAQSPTATDVAAAVERLVPQFLSNDGPSAVSIAVVRNGDTLRTGGWGQADRKNRIMATAVTTYRIGSITKQFTAAAILRLVERRRLGLEDRVDSHLPDVPDAWRSVTIEQLLNHTSGIPDFTEIGERWTRHWKDAMLPAGLLSLVARDKLAFAPGSAWQYSNTGYVLLGMVVERMYGQPYKDVIESEFSRPLALGHTRVCEDDAGANGQAIGYARDGNSFDVAGYRHVSHWFGGGGLCSTVADLASWNAALHGGRVLAPETVKMMTTPRGAAVGRGYGFGVMSTVVSGHREISHSGQFAGFSAFNAWYPEQALSVTVLTNTAPMPTREILARNIGLTALGVPVAISSPVVGLEPEAATLRPYVGDYTIQLPGGKSLGLRIRLNGRRLVAQADGQQALTLYATGPDTFGTAVDPSVQFIFVVEKGAVSRLTFQQAGRNYETTKRR